MDKQINDGGPAFPAIKEWSAELGMSLRDYFAARAPQLIPAWFRPDAVPLPAVPSPYQLVEQAMAQTGIKIGDEEDMRRLRDWLEDGCFDLEPDRLLKVGECANQIREQAVAQREAARQEAEIERYIAWRWHYADLMIAARFA